MNLGRPPPCTPALKIRVLWPVARGVCGVWPGFPWNSGRGLGFGALAGQSGPGLTVRLVSTAPLRVPRLALFLEPGRENPVSR